MIDDCKRCAARAKARAPRLRSFYRRWARSILTFNDSEFWGEVIRRATGSTGLKLTLENWGDHSHEQHEEFGRACKKAQREILRGRRRVKKSGQVT